MKFRKFHKINNARTVQKYACKAGITGSVLYRAVPKLHGTNACVAMAPGGDLFIQSRNRAIDLNSEDSADQHYGFRQFVLDNQDDFRRLLFFLGGDISGAYLYGEWTGPGVQKGVGISGLEQKTFFPFMGITDRAHAWPITTVLEGRVKQLSNPRVRADLLSDQTRDFYINLHTFGSDYPGSELEAYVEEVTNTCPVAGHGLGEGLVLSPYVQTDNFDLWFKLKGSAFHEETNHQAPRPPSKGQDAEAFVLAREVCHQRRLDQGFEYLQEMNLAVEPRNIGTYIKWVVADIEAEEDEKYQTSSVKKACSAIAADAIKSRCL